jgi:predicted RNA-binding Zn-ribbon protein involved in translation (DUF1610 family)
MHTFIVTTTNLPIIQLPMYSSHSGPHCGNSNITRLHICSTTSRPALQHGLQLLCCARLSGAVPQNQLIITKVLSRAQSCHP